KPERSRRDVAEALVECATHNSDVQTRIEALMALRGWGGPEDAEAVAPLTQDGSVAVRGTAMGTLAELKGPAAAEALADLLETEETRTDAAGALEKFGPEAEPALLKRTDHADAKVRVKVVELLAYCGTAASLPALDKALKDPDPWVRNAANGSKQAVSA